MKNKTHAWPVLEGMLLFEIANKQKQESLQNQLHDLEEQEKTHLIRHQRQVVDWLIGSAQENLTRLVSPKNGSAEFVKYATAVLGRTNPHHIENPSIFGFKAQLMRWRATKNGGKTTIGQPGMTVSIPVADIKQSTRVFDLYDARSPEIEHRKTHGIPEHEVPDGSQRSSSWLSISLALRVKSRFSTELSEDEVRTMRIAIVNCVCEQSLNRVSYEGVYHMTPIGQDVVQTLLQLCIPELTFKFFIDKFGEQKSH